MVLYTIAALGVAAQQATGRFGLAAAAPAVESVGTILTVTVAAWLYGTGLQVGQAPVAMMIFLGVGSTVSAAAHAGLQVYGAARAGVLARPRAGWRADPRAAGGLRRMARSVPVAACPATATYLLTVVAGTVPGGVLVIQLSYQVFYALSFIGARAVSVAALPKLAEAAAASDAGRFAAAWRQGLFYVLLVGLPPLCLLATFATPTAGLLANGELRHSALIGELAVCLAVIAFAQLVNGVHDLGRKALFSRLDDRGPRVASFAGLAVSLGVAVSMLLLPLDSRLAGLSLAILATEITAAAIVLSRLRRAVRPQRFTSPRDNLTAVAATLAMTPAIAGGWMLLDTYRPDRIVELAVLICTGAVSLALFALALRTIRTARAA